MTVKVDFYLINETTILGKLQFCCRLIERAFQHQHQVYIDCPQQLIAHQLDELLWTFENDSFIPHNLYGEGPAPAPLIQIGALSSPTHHRDLLMNLTEEIPVYFQQFKRIFEIIIQDEQERTLGRERFRLYRQQGCEIQTHDLAKNK